MRHDVFGFDLKAIQHVERQDELPTHDLERQSAQQARQREGAGGGIDTGRRQRPGANTRAIASNSVDVVSRA